MEVLAPVLLDKEKIYKVVKKTNACIVWGGSVNIAPADDILIQVEKPLLFESYDKIIVSIMAKKIAFGSNHVVIDLPYGEMVKVNNLKEAEIIKEKFQYVASKFKIKIKVLIHKTDEPAGRGIGPILETREALKVLEQKKDRSLDLEIRGLDLAANLLELCLRDSNEKNKKYVEKVYGNCYGWAADILKSGRALKKMQEIIKAQGGNPNVTSDKLKPAKHSVKITAARNCEIKSMNSKNITYIARLLGAPDQKKSGIYLNKKMGEEVEKNNKSQVTFVVGKGEGVREIANSLKKEGLIKDPIAFFLLVRFGLNLDNKIQAGDHRLSPSMNATETAKALTTASNDIWITVPEGQRAQEIADNLQKEIPSYQESWRIKLEANEGYLFPDTYLITKTKAVNLILP